MFVDFFDVGYEMKNDLQTILKFDSSFLNHTDSENLFQVIVEYIRRNEEILMIDINATRQEYDKKGIIVRRMN